MKKCQILLLLVVFLFSSCLSIKKQLFKQEFEYLKSKQANLLKLESFLSQNPNPENISDVSLFISGNKIDNILAGADGFAVQIKEMPGVEISIAYIRTDFSDCFPGLRIRACAIKKSMNMALDLSLTAAIQPIIDEANPSIAKFGVYILDIVPVVELDMTKIRLRGFLKDLLKIKLSQIASALPDFTIPLSWDLAMNIPAFQKDISIGIPNKGGIAGTMKSPAISWMGKLAIDRIISLTDGFHIYASVK